MITKNKGPWQVVDEGDFPITHPREWQGVIPFSPTQF